jgi:hypothetical protein
MHAKVATVEEKKNIRTGVLRAGEVVYFANFHFKLPYPSPTSPRR